MWKDFVERTCWFCCITHINKSHASTLPWNGHCVTVYVYRIWCLPDWERPSVSFLLPCCQFMTRTCRCGLNPSNCFRSKKKNSVMHDNIEKYIISIAVKSTFFFLKRKKKNPAKHFMEKWYTHKLSKHYVYIWQWSCKTTDIYIFIL